MILKSLNGISIILLTLLLSNCSTRNEIPLLNRETGTISYTPKDKNGINAEIILYKGIDKATELPLVANAFTTGENAKVHAQLILNNCKFHQDEDLMFHIDWMDPEGNSIFQKRIDIPRDSIPDIKSTISIQPGKRDTGDYKFMVYLFRELIAEKSFSLVSYNVDSAYVFPRDNSKRISSDISLENNSKKENHREEAGNIFMIKNKARLSANVKLLNSNLYKGKEIKGDIYWCSANDSSFYRKKIDFSPYDTISDVKSTISINNESRQPGKYKIKVYLYGSLIGEKPFELIPEKKEETKIKNLKGVDASIVLSGKIDKKTGEPLNVSDKFIIKDKAKVYASVKLTTPAETKKKSTVIKIDWVGPDNKSVYHKTFKFDANKFPDSVSSLISISPEKRKPGEYRCRVYYNSSLIAEKRFGLTLVSL
jgi:hypothetical protein